MFKDIKKKIYRYYVNYIKKFYYDNIVYRLNPYFKWDGDFAFVCPADLFMGQTKKGVFNRLDTVVAYLYTEECFGKNSVGKNLYKKMQTVRTRQTKTSTGRFDRLIASYEKHGYKKSSYVPLKSNFTLKGGAHRFALAMYYNTDTRIFAGAPGDTIIYSEQWFADNGFSPAEIEIIADKSRELINRFNTPLQMFVFGDIENIKDNIIEKLSRQGSVSFSKSIQCNNITLPKDIISYTEHQSFGNALKNNSCISLFSIRLDSVDIFFDRSIKQPVIKETALIKELLSELGIPAKNIFLAHNYMQNRDFYGKIADLLT